MANVAPGIITNGLGGNASNMILGFFHLGFIEIIIPGSPQIPPIGPRGPGGAGVRPTVVIPSRRDEEERKQEVIIRVRFGKTWHERSFWVLPKNVPILVNIINMLNTSKSRVKLAVSGVRNKISNIIARISNINNKSDDE